MKLLEKEEEEQNNCSKCHAMLIVDMQNGETVCSRCGIVADGQMIDYGPESITTTHEDKMKCTRASGLNTYSQHDLGISTDIAMSKTDFNGKSIDSRLLNKMNNLRNWQKWIRVSNSHERRLATILSCMGEAVDTLGLSKNVLETAAILYRNIDNHMDIKGKSIEGMAAAILYMACKRCDVVRSISEISERMSPTKKPKTKIASKYYRMIVMEMGQTSTPTVSTAKYISKFANNAQVDTRVERLALSIAEKTKKTTIMDGKSPHGIAAAYLYMASTLLGYSLPQREISDVADVTEVTIRNRCKEILTNYNIRIILKPANTR